jgi:P-type conjugative transfer protein TrbG
MLRPTTLLVVLALAGSLRPVQASAAPSEPAGSWTVLPYGASVPTLNCMPLGACAIALDDGETVEGRYLPDTARWEVEPGTTGPGHRPLLAIKPKECGIATNLFVTTDRRVYTFLLNSPPCGDPAQLTPANIRFDQVRFTYPEEFQKIWQEPAAPPSPGVATGARRLDQLNFDYTWSAGSRALEPRVVYDDGSRTYIVLREEDRHRDAPAVFVRGEHDALEAVNFTPPVNGGLTYIVDRVGPEIILVSGSKSYEKTLIHRRTGR